MDRISAHVEARGEGTVRVSLKGSITQETSSELKSVFQTVLDRAPRRVDLECAGVDYIASAGVGVLVSLLRKLRTMNADLRLLNLQPDIEELFGVTHLDRIFTLAREAEPTPTV